MKERRECEVFLFGEANWKWRDEGRDLGGLEGAEEKTSEPRQIYTVPDGAKRGV